jgi:DNA-directed RNA polymerase subunit RPC12/RpoP
LPPMPRNLRRWRRSRGGGRGGQVLLDTIQAGDDGTIQRQRIHCHRCNRWVEFDLNTSLNGNHVLDCPNCGHRHCRVVQDGVITGIRWSRSMRTYIVTANSLIGAAGISSSYLGTLSQSIGSNAANSMMDLWQQTTRVK